VPKKAPKPKAEPKPPQDPRCAALRKVLESYAYVKTIEVWHKVQDLGADQAVPHYYRVHMDRLEWAQWHALNWNKRKCGPPVPIIDLPTLST
jgi:hypothetical protein